MKPYYSLREHIRRTRHSVVVRMVLITGTAIVVPLGMSLGGHPTSISYYGWLCIGLVLATVSTTASTYLEYVAIRKECGYLDDLAIQHPDPPVWPSDRDA